ncbi:site-specific integrase, partial [Gordonia sp. ABSL1-1]|nr:site-specific integrase [Gordonia sp. ABSL1-1]
YSKYLNAKGQTRWRVQYQRPDHTGTSKPGFLTKKAAEDWYSDTHGDMRRGKHVSAAAGRVKLGELHDDWMDTKLRAKPSWRERLDQHWRLHVEPEWGHRAVSSITETEVQSWIALLTGVQSPSSIADIVGVLVGVLDVAKDQRRIHENPARGRTLPRREPVDHEYLTHAQVHQLADEVSKYREIVMLLAYTACAGGSWPH